MLIIPHISAQRNSLGCRGRPSLSGWLVALIILFAPVVIAGEGVYTLYRASAHQCMIVANPTEFQPKDRIFGGPYPLKKALVEVKKACPVPYSGSGEWFAVQRKEACWIVRNEVNLKEGDVIIDGNLSRDLAAASVLGLCDAYGVDEGGLDEAQPPSAPAGPGPEEYTWQETSVPWVKVQAPKGAAIVTKVIDVKTLPAGDFKSISPCVSIKPQGDGAIPSAVRITMPETVQIPPEDRGRVALAFYEESYSSCTGEVESRWRLHAADYDPQTGTWSAELNHGCFIIWGLVTLAAGVTYLAWDDATRLLMTKRASDHFVLHYDRDKVSDKRVAFTIDELEKARAFLTGALTQGGLGLNYPSTPAKLDVYYVKIKSKKGVIYGLYQQGKTGEKWMDLNLPSMIPNYDRNVMTATLAHELFHFIQFSYEGYSTFKDAWWRKAKQMVISGNTFPYGWLNEGLSSAVELTAVKTPTFIPAGKSPIMNNDLYIKGLKGLTTANDGYSAGLFIDFLVHRYGVEIYSAILNECRRQVASGTKRDAFVAIKRAVSRLGRKRHPGDPNFTEMDTVWQLFTYAFICEEPGTPKIDGRPDRKIPFTNKSPFRLTVGEDETLQRWAITVPLLSLKPLAAKTFNLVPAAWNDEDKAIVDCNVTFTPGESMPFEIDTLIALATRKGEHALLPIDALLFGRVNRKVSDLTLTLNLEKKNRFNLLTFIPTGLGARTDSGKAEGSYLLSCKLRKEEKLLSLPAVPVSTHAIDTYWWALWQTAVTMKATGRWAYEVCPTRCDDLNRKAEDEEEELWKQIRGLEERIDALEQEIRPFLTIITHDLDAFGEMDDSLWEISNNYEDMRMVCEDATNVDEQCFSNSDLYPLGNKATVVQHFSWLHNERSLIMRKELPTKEEIQKALDCFHEGIAQIKPCRSAVTSFRAYWQKHREEALKKVEEIKTRHPSLK